ncbi:MAG: class B sortase [Bacillota bacterium]
MRSDRDQPEKPPRRNPSAPVPGMPYRMHSDLTDEPSAAHRREVAFVESNPMPDPRGAARDGYNPWEEQGWVTGETAFPACREPEVLQEERYFKPMLDLSRELPQAYGEYTQYEGDDAYPKPVPENPVYSAQPPVAPPLPPPQKPARRPEPLRTAIILCCVAALLFCGVEVFRIAQNLVQSEMELREYRELYLKEYNEDFTLRAEAVALRPPGETYPPTASPVPVQTPTPTPRIAQNDPLIAAMSGGIDPGQSVTPGSPTPAVRSVLERYPDNPLLVVRGEIAALQAENPDIVGRLIIDGLLNEIVALRNNIYYLNHNSMGAYSGYGAVFADEKISFRTPPENILLFGRTSNEGKAFAPLKNYIGGGLDFAGRYAFLSFNSLYEEARYVIIAIVQASSDPNSPEYFDYKDLSFATDEDMIRYAQSAMSRTLYIFNVGVLPTDRLLTLVTLSDGADASAVVIVCRMLREGERDGYIQSD